MQFVKVLKSQLHSQQEPQSPQILESIENQTSQIMELLSSKFDDCTMVIEECNDSIGAPIFSRSTFTMENLSGETIPERNHKLMKTVKKKANDTIHKLFAENIRYKELLNVDEAILEDSETAKKIALLQSCIKFLTEKL